MPWGNMHIRDGEVEIIDAIAYASWLRSKISAHGVNELTPKLSPYDVINVQNIVRRLLLERLGFLRNLQLGYWVKNEEKGNRYIILSDE